MKCDKCGAKFFDMDDTRDHVCPNRERGHEIRKLQGELQLAENEIALLEAKLQRIYIAAKHALGMPDDAPTIATEAFVCNTLHSLAEHRQNAARNVVKAPRPTFNGNDIAESLRKARFFGAEYWFNRGAAATTRGEYLDSVAQAFGYSDWKTVPTSIKRVALSAFERGIQDERHSDEEQ